MRIKKNINLGIIGWSNTVFSEHYRNCMVDSKENNIFDLGVKGLISTGTQWYGKLTLCTEFINDNGKLKAKTLYI